MNVDKILRTGYFDEIRVDGTCKPIFRSSGTLIKSDTSFKSLLEDSEEGFKHGVANILIQLTGGSTITADIEDMERMREDRESSGIKRIPGSSTMDKYLIAYADILLLKSNYSIPFELKASGKDRDSLYNAGTTQDMKEILVEALNLSDKIEDKYKYPKDCISIAIVNKVYVLPVFRRSGISTWIHNNIADLVNMYGLQFPTGILLTYGDFSQEAGKLFGMDNAAYNKMLRSYYKKLGYKSITQNGVVLSIGDQVGIMYKILV